MLDQLKVSKAFTQALLELCMEISKDNGWEDILANVANMRDKVVQAMSGRAIGEYAADRRAKVRRHNVER